MRTDLTPDAVKRHLAARIHDLAQTLIPDGTLEGGEWRGHGPDGAKWGIVIKGGKTGYFQNFGTGTGGTSALALIRDAACEGDHKRAWTWALQFLGEATPELPPAAQPSREPRPAGTTGLGLFLSGAESTWHDPVGLYLQARGIEPGRFPRPLRALRYHPTVWHAEAGRAMACMLAAVIDPVTRAHIATHRTYLARDRAGTWCKTMARPAKKVLGAFRGGLIPLTRGATGRAWRSMREDDEQGVVIAEGIENALTAAQWYPELRAVACVAAANLPQITLPDAVPAVLLVRDRDGENLAIKDARDAALVRWHDEGRAVSVWEPPERYKDANDFWQAVQAGRCDA